MLKAFSSFILLFVVFLCPVQLIAGILDWRYVASDHYVLYYRAGWETKAKSTLNYLELAHPYVAAQVGNKSPKLGVVLEDIGLEANGYVSQYPFQMRLFPKTPGTGSDLCKDGDVLRWLTTHEQSHAAESSNTSGWAKGFVDLFGNTFNPHWASLSWMAEGLAVNVESRLGPNAGRLHHGYYDAVLLSKGYYGQFPSFMNMNIDNVLQFPGGFWYQYGAKFWQYISKKFGPESIVRFNKEWGQIPNFGNIFFIQSEFPDFYGIDMAFKAVYHQSITEVYDAWKRDSIAESRDWVVGGTRQTWDGWSKSSTCTDGTYVYYVTNYAYRPTPYNNQGMHILKRLNPATGETSVVTYLPSSVAGMIQYVNGYLYVATTETKFGYDNISSSGYGSISVLKKIDPHTGAVETVLYDAGDAIGVAENGTVYYAKENQKSEGSELWKFEGGQRKSVFNSSQVIGEIIPDLKTNSLIMVTKPMSQAWNINRFDLATNKMTPIVNSTGAETTVKRYGDSLVFTGVIEGKYGVYKIGVSGEKMEKLSQATFAKEGEIVGNSLLFVGMTDKGEDLFSAPLSPTLVSFIPEKIQNFTPPQTAYTEGPAWERNYTQDLPYARLWKLNPSSTVTGLHRVNWDKFTILGQDVLGLNSYTIQGGAKGPEVSLSSKEFLPFELSVSKALQESATTVNVTLPLYRSNEFGLQSLSAGLVIHLDGSATDYGPALYSTYEVSPFTLFQTAHDYRTTSTQLDSSYTWHQFMPDYCQLSVNFHEVHRLNGSEISSGLTHSWESTAVLTAQIAKLNWGLWSPNIYFEGMYARITGQANSSGITSVGSQVFGTRSNPYMKYEMVFEGYLANGKVRVVPTFGVDNAGQLIYTLGGMLIFQ